MDFLELAKQRYSVRSFRPDSVPEELIEKILEAGNAAPTACNRQPVRIIAAKSPEALEKFRRCTECHFNAPLGFVICADSSREWARSYDGKRSGDIDAAIVTTHMMLEAAALGLGTTWVMYFNPEAVRAEFELPGNLEPVALLPAGYPAENAKPSLSHTMFRPREELFELL